MENRGYDSGAITLSGDSTLYLEANSSVTFVRNHAYHYGGAIYYVDDYIEKFDLLVRCFYGILATVTEPLATLRNVFHYVLKTHIAIEFYNNTAEFAGSAIYGGWVDLCSLYINYPVIDYASISRSSVFDSLFHFHQPTQQLSLVSSNPTRVCLCTNTSIPDCNVTEYTITTYPGETLTIPAVAVGQRFRTVPSTVQSNFVYLTDLLTDNVRLPELQYTQLVNVSCTNLMYTILSTPNS